MDFSGLNIVGKIWNNVSTQLKITYNKGLDIRYPTYHFIFNGPMLSEFQLMVS